MDGIAHTEPHFGPTPAGDAAIAAPPPEAGRPAALRWLMHDLPYITMLLLALIGVVLKLPFAYWVILMPLFGVISIVEGWRYTESRQEQLQLVWRMALTWCALLLAIFLLFADSLSSVLSGHATGSEMLTLLALGTFTAGVQAREWRICAVGGLLFLAVPALAWLHQSPLLMSAAAAAVIALGGLAWWVLPDRSVRSVDE